MDIIANTAASQNIADIVSGEMKPENLGFIFAVVNIALDLPGACK